jgi:hypothetical protein
MKRIEQSSLLSLEKHRENKNVATGRDPVENPRTNEAVLVK